MIEVARILQFMATKSVPPGRVLARIATRQHGVVSRPQVAALGVDGGFVNRCLRDGRLHRIHAGVYAVGHRHLIQEGRWMAAVLAAGEGAVLSHLSAALLWRLIDRADALMHVLLPGRGSRRRPGIRFHRCRNFRPEHRSERDGIPVTTPERTLLDIAGLLPPERLRYAVEAADRRRLLDAPSLAALCAASPGRRGTGALRRLALEQRGAVERTKSPPEALFLRLCIARGLPEPLVNARLHGYEVDFQWPAARLVVEIDSYTYHRAWAQRQRDLRRDAALQVRGHRVLRLTEDRLRGEADAVFAEIAALLGMESPAAL